MVSRPETTPRNERHADQTALFPDSLPGMLPVAPARLECAAGGGRPAGSISAAGGAHPARGIGAAGDGHPARRRFPPACRRLRHGLSCKARRDDPRVLGSGVRRRLPAVLSRHGGTGRPGLRRHRVAGRRRSGHEHPGSGPGHQLRLARQSTRAGCAFRRALRRTEEGQSRRPRPVPVQRGPGPPEHQPARAERRP